VASAGVKDLKEAAAEPAAGKMTDRRTIYRPTVGSSFGGTSMATVPAAFHRRLAQLWMLVLLIAASGRSAVVAQTPVIAGSITPNSVTASQQIGQIYQLLVANNGDVLLLDTQAGALYEIQAGSTNLITLSAPGTVLRGNGAFWNSGMALDQWNNLYIGGIYGPQPDFYRVPFDPTTNTWPLTGSSSWTAGDNLVGGLGVNQIAFMDGNGGSTQTMVISTETSPQIMEFTVDANGNVGSATVLVKSLAAAAAKITADHAGNVYFIEEPYNARTTVAVGLWMIPAGSSSNVVGEVAPVVRIDPPADGYNFKGLRFDAAGDLLLSSTIDTGGTSGGDGNFDGVLMVPNESGSPTTAIASSLNWNHATLLSPVTATASVAVDPRGILWIPTSVSGWAPIDSKAGTPPTYPNTLNFVIYNLGSANAGNSPLGTAGSTASVYFTFNSAVTPSKFVFVEDGQSGSDFSAVTTNPIMNPASASGPATVDTTVVPCTPGTTYQAGQHCPYWIALNPTAIGSVTGQLQMLDASNNIIAKSAINLHGQGQGPGISILGAPAETAIGSGYNQPKQVAVDAKGNVYVADEGQGKVLEYSAGSSTGVAVGTGVAAPTGVAVDGIGNVYIGDSGKVFKVPYQSGALNSAGQTTLISGLGNNLNLAVDGAGNVYVADKDKAQVVKASTPTVASTILAGTTVTVGSGFTAPTAVAVDGSGNVFIADGSSLDEVSYWGGQSTITTQLSGAAPGLALDASGSVYVAESSNLVRIPMLSGALSFNSSVSIDTINLKSPTSVAIDRTGNLYVSYLNTSGAESVAQVGINGTHNMGVVTPLVLSTGEAQIFNIGNQPLVFSAFTGDTYSGTLAADYSLQAPNDTPACDPSTPTAIGSSCYFGVGITPSILSGTESAALSIHSNAGNAPTSTLTVSANPAVDNRPATTATISPIAAITYPGSVTITVTVTSAAGTPQGDVTLSINNNVGSSTQTLNSSGVATFTFSNLTGGTYNVNATYKGYGTLGTAPDFAVSSAKQAILTVNAATPTFTVSTPATYILLNGTSTITATVSSSSGVPTGTISFMNGSSLADPSQGPVTLTGQGQATFNTSKLALGTYNLTAVYSGDQNFAKASIPVSTFNIISPSVLITAAPASLTVAAGTSGSVMLTLQGLVGYGGTTSAVNLSCDTKTLPQYSECSFSSPNVPMTTANGSAQVTLTINTNIPVNAGALRMFNPHGNAIVFAGTFALGLFGLGLRRRKRFHSRLLTLACLTMFICSLTGLVGCTNAGYTNTPPAPVVTTPSGSSAVAVSATDSQSGKVVSIPFALPVTVK
jgi:sugar lactone lactonase YvrE